MGKRFIGQILFDYVSSRSDIGLLHHWHKMTVCVGNIAAGEKKSDPLYAEKRFLSAGNFLTQIYNFMSNIRWQIVKVIVVLDWNDLDMPGPDWPYIQKCDQIFIPIDLMHLNFGFGNPAENALFAHFISSR